MDEIILFLKEYIERDYDIPEDENLMEFKYLESGYIDSIALFSFMAAIEKRFNIEITDEDMMDRNLATIGGLAEFIKRKVER